MFKEISSQLENLALSQKLENLAIQTCQSWMTRESSLPETVELKFHSHGFIFKHHLIDHPFIRTRLTLIQDDQEIGYYDLITQPDGQVEDDYFVLHPDNSHIRR